MRYLSFNGRFRIGQGILKAVEDPADQRSEDETRTTHGGGSESFTRPLPWRETQNIFFLSVDRAFFPSRSCRRHGSICVRSCFQESSSCNPPHLPPRRLVLIAAIPVQEVIPSIYRESGDTSL